MLELLILLVFIFIPVLELEPILLLFSNPIAPIVPTAFIPIDPIVLPIFPPFKLFTAFKFTLVPKELLLMLLTALVLIPDPYTLKALPTYLINTLTWPVTIPFLNT